MDDELAILEALRRRLRMLRKDWAVVVASSGAAAIAILQTQPIDVVVTDMRMPGIHGLAVLECAKKNRPSAIRLMLSGQIDSADVEATVGIAHHTFSKPCRVETIIERIEQGGPRT